MQSSSVAQPDAILDWLQKEMNYRPLGPYHASSKASIPSSDAIRRVCRGNMIPVFNFLLNRVKSEKTVIDIRRNILVHGIEDNASGRGDAKSSGDRKVIRGGKKKEKAKVMNSNSDLESNNRDTALQERETAEKEVERLRHIVRRKRKELKARMLEVSRDEADRKRMLDERSNYRHKHVMLEAYDEQCDEAARIFAQYHKRLLSYVNYVKNGQRLDLDSSMEVEKFDIYSTLEPADDVFLTESNKERNIRMACESLAEQMIEKIQTSCPAYEGIGIRLNPQLETDILGIDFDDDDISDDVRDVIVNYTRNPCQLLLAVTAYSQRLKSLIAKEIDRIDVTADAERLRYKFENNRVIDAPTDLNSPLQLQLYGNANNKNNNGLQMPSKGSQHQLLERQKAHVQQFVATEDQLNKAAEATTACQKLLKRLYGTSDVNSSFSFGFRGTAQHVSSLRQLELDVWSMERETAGLKASLTTLTTEVQRLNLLLEERKESEDSLNNTLKKIEEFDSRRLELKSISDALIKANTDAASFWSQQPLVAREDASKTIIPACTILINKSNVTKHLIDKEVSVFSRIPDNSFYMLPSTPQALLEFVGPTGSTGPDAITAAEKNAARLTTRAGAGDPSAIPSISRVSAALQYPSGSEGSLASVLESMEFCLKSRGSEACVLEELSKAINLVHTTRDLVESGHALLNHAHNSQKEYKRTTNDCLDLASEQEQIIATKWLPEIKNEFANAQKTLDECKYVDGLLVEWWEQPASTVVDWVAVDGQNVAAWHNHVKQLLAYYDKQLR